MNPAFEDSGSYSIYILLTDDNSPPLSSKYEFELQVLDTRFNFLEDKKKEREQQIFIPDPVYVEIFPPDEYQNFKVRFSRDIALPTNCSHWSNLNEGKKRLQVEYLPSENTQTILYDQDLQIFLNWEVVKVHIDRWVSTFNSKDERRYLNRTEEKPLGLVTREELAGREGMIDVNYFIVKLDFTLPEIVSRQAEDSLSIEVQRNMFNEEFDQLPENVTQYMVEQKIDFQFKHKVMPIRD